MFKFSGRGSYSVQSMLTFVHWLFKSNTLKCAPLSIWSKLVQTMFKLCSKFKLCSNYVQRSYLFKLYSKWNLWNRLWLHICTLFKHCSKFKLCLNSVQTLFKLFSNIKHTYIGKEYQFYAVVNYTLQYEWGIFFDNIVSGSEVLSTCPRLGHTGPGR